MCVYRTLSKSRARLNSKRRKREGRGGDVATHLKGARGRRRNMLSTRGVRRRGGRAGRRRMMESPRRHTF